MASLKFKLQNYWFSWCLTLMMNKGSWKLLSKQIFVLNGFLVLWYSTLEFLSFWVTRHVHDFRVIKRVTYFGTYFGQFGYLSSSCIGKSIMLMFLSSSRAKSTLLWQNSVTWMFLLVSGRHVGAHPDGHQHGVSIQTPINKGKKLLRISCIRKIADLNPWSESLHSCLLSFLRCWTS